ncbi:MAG: hypothetical protein U0746_20800 [Gemmataceae bacterium]
MSHSTRRTFLRTAATHGAMLGGGFGILGRLPPVRADEAKPDPDRVRLTPDTESLVRLIETTQRERLIEEVSTRIRNGTSYRELLTGLLLAGVRNIQPRPAVGFKFHAVLVVNSAHLASLAAPDTDRWLPLFWALDNFKSSQATNAKEGGWYMKPVDEGKVPSPAKAVAEFTAAMDTWDVPRADTAAAGIARTLTPHQAFELFVKYGARDFRDIGHKAIFVANSFRTLQTIGWHHAEPVLRSLAYALLKYDGDNPSTSDAAPDRPGRRNRELAARPVAADGTVNGGATTELVAALRTGSDSEVADRFVEALVRGTASPGDAWDAMYLGAGELLLRQPGIVALHAMTTTNALHYAYETVTDEATRRWLMLQNASFVTLFRDALKGRGKVGDTHIDELAAEPVKGGVEELFATASTDKLSAAKKALGYLSSGGDARLVTDVARHLVFSRHRLSRRLASSAQPC